MKKSSFAEMVILCRSPSKAGSFILAKAFRETRMRVKRFMDYLFNKKRASKIIDYVRHDKIGENVKVLDLCPILFTPSLDNMSSPSLFYFWIDTYNPDFCINNLSSTKLFRQSQKSCDKHSSKPRTR